MSSRKGAVNYSTFSQNHTMQPLKVVIVKTNLKHKKVALAGVAQLVGVSSCN